NTETKKKRRRIVLIILVSILLISFTYEKVGEFIDSKKYEPPGRLVEVNGHMMHIYGEGTSNNTPTVVFTSGWKTPSPYVDYYPLLENISEYTRAVVYERPGYGWSEVANGKRGIDTITEELHQLLVKSGEQGPYILVGHSFGSNEVLRYSQLYSEEVAGVVLIDGSNPDYTSTIKRAANIPLWYGSVNSTIFNNVINFLNDFGITRVVFSTTDLYVSKLTSYKNSLLYASQELQELDEAMFIKTLNNKNHFQELRMDASILLENRGIENIPLKIISSSLYNGSETTRNIQQGLLSWSSDSEQFIIEDSQHYVHWFNPQAVSSIILDLINR
ncbi:MAG: alpha/beta hydrolase, partial [Eubacteriales bacterium]|nr:alpha/beta hydrolase [Eubacteriales bacterium]